MPENNGSYWDVVEPAWDDLCTGLDEPTIWPVVQQRYPSHVVNLFTAHFCQSEVRNGGWLQFFWNSTGIIGPEAVTGFEHIGMPQAAVVAREAVAMLGEPYPRAREQRWDALLASSPLDGDEMRAIFASEPNSFIAYRKASDHVRFDALNRRFWELLEAENGGFDTSADRYVHSLHLHLLN